VLNEIFSSNNKFKIMATFVVKSNLNVTVSVIKNAPDDMQFVYFINMTICGRLESGRECNVLACGSRADELAQALSPLVSADEETSR